MISKSAINNFLERPCRDSNNAKLFTDRALDAKLKDLGAYFHTEPRRAQKICYLLGWYRESYLFLMGMGAGKTKLALDLFVNRFRLTQVERMLVLVPNVVNLGAWEEETKKHAPGVTLDILDMPGEEARMSVLLDTGKDVIAVTYKGFVQLVTKTLKNEKTGKNKWVLDPKACDRIAAAFQMLVLDESTELKNHDTVTFKAMRRLASKILYRYELTGTPFDKDPIDLWSQFFIVDGGWTLGETLGLYRSAFFTMKNGYWGGVEYDFKKRMKGELHRRLRHCSIRFREDECQDLPEAVGGITDPMIQPVKMPASTWTYYEKMIEEMQGSMGNYTLMDNTYTRMRMLASGYLVAKDLNEERVEITFPENPKLDALEELLREISEEEKVIVVHIFNRSGELCAERLTKMGVSFVHVYGKTPPGKKLSRIDEFKDPKGPRVLLGSSAIAYGSNFQKASGKMIFFESPDSGIVRTQIERRILRGEGHFKTCYFYDLVVNGTVDRDILESVRTGRKLMDVVIDGVKKGRTV